MYFMLAMCALMQQPGNGAMAQVGDLEVPVAATFLDAESFELEHKTGGMEVIKQKLGENAAFYVPLGTTVAILIYQRNEQQWFARIMVSGSSSRYSYRQGYIAISHLRRLNKVHPIYDKPYVIHSEEYNAGIREAAKVVRTVRNTKIAKERAYVGSERQRQDLIAEQMMYGYIMRWDDSMRSYVNSGGSAGSSSGRTVHVRGYRNSHGGWTDAYYRSAPHRH